MQSNFYRLYGKRFLDLIFIIPGLILLFPIYFLIILLILIFDGLPIFYIQSRVGKDLREFTLYKFRTMINDPMDSGPLLTEKNDVRVTRIGRLLRKYKLDELPQFLNIIFGDMSIVGPRPEVPQYVRMFKQDYMDILKVKPGLADYGTLKYHNEEENFNKFENIQDVYVKEILPEKIKLYKQYINDQSLVTDIKIILKTIWKILR